MSRGDNLFGIKTIYKGITMRSRLETKFAYFLDALKIRWIYEPKSFFLSSGITYIPDFYLPELDMWIEVKGNILEHNKDIIKQFAQDNNAEIAMISDKDIYYCEGDLFEDICMQIGKCSICNKHFFCSNIGNYHCRNCQYHNGDYDIFASFSKADMLDFSNADDIKRWIKKHGTRV